MADWTQILADGLKRAGYDGLFSPDSCACTVDDLCPCCDGPTPCCDAGVFTDGPCYNCDGNVKPCDFHIGHGKPHPLPTPTERTET